MDKIAAIVALLVALSAAAERLVEIIKGLVPWLNTKRDTDALEGRRRTALQSLAVAAGIVTALMARPAIPPDLFPEQLGALGILALGLLASGGSGLWNSILTYVLEAKNMKEGLATLAAAKGEVAERVGDEAMARPRNRADGNGRTLEAAAETLARLDIGPVSVVPLSR